MSAKNSEILKGFPYVQEKTWILFSEVKNVQICEKNMIIFSFYDKGLNLRYFQTLVINLYEKNAEEVN